MRSGADPWAPQQLLSPAQQQLWSIDRMQPGTSLYNIPLALRLCGHLDIPALEASLTDILRRHEVLRAVFRDEDGVPLQSISALPEISLPVTDLSDSPADTRDIEIQDCIDAEAEAPFDLAEGPLVRSSLLRVLEHEHVLLLTLHHIVFDGASAGLFFRELGAHYAARLHGAPADLPPLLAQYADYSAWQREQPNGEHLTFWRAKLKDLPARLQLPTDRPRPVVQAHRGASIKFEVPDELRVRVDELSERSGVTPFVTLLAAFKVLLARYTGQDDLVIGVPVSGRPHEDFDPLIGCFANVLVVRTDLGGNLDFREVLARVADQMMDAFEHMDAQFDAVVEVVQPERDPSYTPLVQVTFSLLTDDAGEYLDLPGLSVEALEAQRATAKFDLSLDMVRTERRMYGDIEYDTDLFDDSTIGRFAGHWLSLLAAAVADPDTPMSALPMLTPREREQMVVEWNRTERDFAGPVCLHEMFEAQARRTPYALAVVSGEQRITYRELDERANRLAHALRRRGAGPETGVGVCMARSAHTIVSFLAVLKSGGVYVPLDPDYPPERMAFMLGDAQVSILVTNSETASALPDGDVELLLIDSVRAEIESCPSTAPVTSVGPANLSCMFYTSGSSGMPKCAMLTHANYANYVDFWIHRYLRDTPMRVHLQMTSFAFDIFIADTTRALFTGATLVICPQDVVLAPARLYELMVREQVNSAEFITPILASLVDYVEASGKTLEFLDVLIAGSDIWYAKDFMRARRLCAPTTRMIAAYGLSETSIDNSTFDDGDFDRALEGIVPIGRPVANTTLYVLNEHLQPLPAGLAGELYVGGTGVGRGYHRRPGLTAERYLPDPFSGRPGSRLYKSGDLARYRPDGVLEILGRVDNQVKVGGFRIELGEIESVLRGCPSVENAVVVVHERAPGDRRLVGYVTLEHAGKPVLGPVREFLRAQLPGYMVPAALIALDALPLNANGKVDRRALPAPTEELLKAEEPHRPSRTPTEEIIAGIWAEVLGRAAPIGGHDNFFAAGGRSLLMTQVVSRIRKVWQVDLQVGAFYQEPTIAALARRVELLRAGGSGTGVPPMTRTARGPDTVLDASYQQQQLWFHDQLEPASAAYNVPAAFRLHGHLDTAALERAVRAITDRHEVLRTVFTQVHGVPAQGVGQAPPIGVGWSDLSGLPLAERHAEVRSRVQAEERRPFDLTCGPLVRVSVLRLAPVEHVLLLTMHHVVTDGWSTTLLFEELSAAYAAQARGERAELPELPLQYADFAVWQRRWLDDETVRGHAAHWRQRLDGAPEVTALPTDRPRSAVRGYDGAYASFTLPPELSCRLRQLSGERSVTLFMSLVAAFQVLLSRYSGQEDLVVGVPHSGRGQVELERLIGFFVNVLPLRTDLSGDPSFAQVLERVRTAALDAHEHQDVPFEKVVELVGPRRRQYQNPIFQTVFSLEPPNGEGLAMPGLRVEEIPFETTTAKFDLLLEMAETTGGLRGGFSYKTDLFDAATIGRMIEHWHLLLTAVADNPDAPVSTLPVPRIGAAQREESAPEQDRVHLAPRTPFEGLVAAVWGEVLGVPDVSMNADFFELGGYSLLGSRLAADLEAVLGHRISLRQLFENPTPAALTLAIEAEMSETGKDRIAELLAELETPTGAGVPAGPAHD